MFSSIRSIIRSLIDVPTGLICLLLAVVLSASAAGVQADPPTFDSVNGIVRNAQQVVSLEDGKIVVLGNAGEDGEALEIVRFNPDGTTNATFRPGDLGLSSVSSITPLPNGQLLLASETSSVGDTEIVSRLIRLNSDGSIDTAFHPGAAYGDTPIALPDGKLLLLAENAAEDGTVRTTFERLNSDGQPDPTFHTAMSFDPAREYAVYLQGDGKLLVSSNGEDGTSPTLVRLNDDGSFDPSFTVSLLAPGRFTNVLPLSNGKVAVAFSGNTGDTNVVLQFNGDGTFDPAFHQSALFDDTITTLASLPDGSLIVVGDFRSVNSLARNGAARLGPDGKLDTTRHLLETVGQVFGALVQPSSKVIELLSNESKCGLAVVDSHSSVHRLQGLDDGFAPPPAPAVTIVNQQTDDGFAPPPAPGARVVRGPPVVTIMVTQPVVYSGSAEPGQFILQRTGNRYAQRVRVVYRLGGTAFPGRDYRALGCVKIIPAGQQSARIDLRPVGERFGAVERGHVNVTLTLVHRPGYQKGFSATAKIKIIDPETASNLVR